MNYIHEDFRIHRPEVLTGKATTEYFFPGEATGVVDENQNSNNQFDGATEVQDLDKTDSNKALVTKYTKEVYIDKNLDSMNQYLHLKLCMKIYL